MFKTASSVPQPQGKQVADWYREASPEPIEILHALAHMKASRDDLLEALEGISRLARSTDMTSERFQLNAIADHADITAAKARKS